uniref:Uncharacterized protein LOC110214275 n=1 Tax=Phascolarctos cinereus TaxID=38626 RepID=A0A6P5L577_PHACI|nr:uncharacterized protein LOC110214275 [Phascolarctos cinereus]
MHQPHHQCGHFWKIYCQGVMEILCPLGSCLFNSPIAFFLLLMMPKMALGQFSVIGPAGPIKASLGGEAELPCYLSPPQSAQHMEVLWLQSTRMVHLYRDEKDQFGDQDPDYQGRTELVRDAITSGNVTPEDTGCYDNRQTGRMRMLNSTSFVLWHKLKAVHSPGHPLLDSLGLSARFSLGISIFIPFQRPQALQPWGMEQKEHDRHC